VAKAKIRFIRRLFYYNGSKINKNSDRSLQGQPAPLAWRTLIAEKTWM
jgi:hypothetical protein